MTGYMVMWHLRVRTCNSMLSAAESINTAVMRPCQAALAVATKPGPGVLMSIPDAIDQRAYEK